MGHGHSSGIADQAVDRLDETVENRDRANVFTRPAQRIGLVDECSDDKVAAHFVDHRGTALTEFAVQRRARAQTQLTKRLLAEAVDSGDRGLVEVGDHGGYTFTTPRRFSLVRVEEHLHPWMAVGHPAAVERGK